MAENVNAEEEVEAGAIVDVDDDELLLSEVALFLLLRPFNWASNDANRSNAECERPASGSVPGLK